MTDATPVPQPAAPFVPAEDQRWASFAHFGGVLGPLPSLIIFLVFKDRGALTKQESKEALNWQITFTIGVVVFNVLAAIFTLILNVAGAYAVINLVGLLLWFPYVVNVIFSIMGGVKVNGGGTYRYPVALRLVK